MLCLVRLPHLYRGNDPEFSLDASWCIEQESGLTPYNRERHLHSYLLIYNVLFLATSIIFLSKVSVLRISTTAFMLPRNSHPNGYSDRGASLEETVSSVESRVKAKWLLLRALPLFSGCLAGNGSTCSV